ncbi:MAG: ferritin [Heliobacteriaceae bacterium]|jgi:ferritin|nr:ferritin [Heliobacteriaceae bacterium]
MINEQIENILNEQINKEFYSAYLYLAMSAFFNESGFFGLANWTKVQAREEIDHGMIIFDHILERNGDVMLKEINAPDVEFTTPLEVFTLAYEHEKTVTASIDEIAKDSQDECDFATRNFINWYIKEQIEEEAQTLDIVNRLKLFGDDKAALYHIDAELGLRVYEPPAL